MASEKQFPYSGHGAEGEPIPLHLSPVDAARLSATHAANASQQAREARVAASRAADGYLEVKTGMFMMAADVSKTKDSVRDVMRVVHAIARHLNISVDDIPPARVSDKPPVSERASQLPPPRPRSPSAPDMIPYGDDDAEITATGHNVVVGVREYNRMSQLAAEFDRLKKESEERALLKKLRGFKEHAMKGVWGLVFTGLAAGLAKLFHYLATHTKP